ncbi:MAG TPA: Asp-tRNA(Asn)/Glu-tRNA(Gln) amidotransferase subunit GatA, partial [Sulfuricurvum sp.]|nr:Asp-tRNA(Asn)/Glu-tRNA(Gln) amidotransferase subunit GatA [Sulfuricurvum sp.]
MMTLKEALKCSADEIAALRSELQSKIEADSELGAYVGMETVGEGIPIAVKDNIQVREWSVTSGSKILQGYIAPYNATV